MENSKTTGRTLLMVEDDEESLAVYARTLASGGYDVVWARNGPDTLKLLTRREEPLALMVVDVVLPEMSGPALVEEVRRTHPGIGVLYVSGYDVDAVRSHGVDPEAVPFLAKPFEPDALLEAVVAALGGN